MLFSEFLNDPVFADVKNTMNTKYPSFLKHIQLTFFNRTLLYSTQYTTNYISNLLEVFNYELKKAEDMINIVNSNTISADNLGVKQTSNTTKQNTESYTGYNVEGDYQKDNTSSDMTFKTLDLPTAINKFGRMELDALYIGIDIEMGSLFQTIVG